MKRFLLTMICAIAMVAVNAQSLSSRFNVANLNNVKCSRTQTMKTMTTKFMLNSANKSVVDNKVAPVKSDKTYAAAPASTNAFEGNWVAEFTDWCGDNYDIAYSAASQSEITVETEEGVEYVVIPGLAGGYADVKGIYDAEAGVINIPAQVCYEHPTYGKFLFAKGKEDGDDLNIDTENPYQLTVTVEENGHITLTGEEGYYWITLIMEGDYEGYLWNYGEDLVINKANYEFTSTASLMGDEGWLGWEEQEPSYVYFENIEGTGILHGMFDSSIMVNMSEDGYEFTIPNGQVVTAYLLVQGGKPQPFYTYNSYVGDDGYIESPVIEGPDCYLPDPDFEIGGGLTTTNQWVIANFETNYYNYMYVARYTSETGGYFDGVWGRMTFTPIEGEPEVGPSEEDGIASVAADKKANNITFNVAGQQVSKDYKGLVIRNGQKFMNK